MKKICLLLINGFEAAEASVFTDVLGWNLFEGDGSTEVIAVGTKDTLKCTWNFTVLPEKLMSEVSVDDFDALAIPGGFEEAGFYEDAYREEVAQFIREFHDRGKTIATICVASLVLGHSGILKGKKATTYHLSEGRRQKQLADFGADLVPDQPIVDEGQIITSYSPATAFDVAFTLLEKLTSVENTNNVRRLMGFDEKE